MNTATSRSYEEWVVDREVEASWLQFRVRLADHLAAMDEGDVLRLGVSGVDQPVVTVLFRAAGRLGFDATWSWADGGDRSNGRRPGLVRFSRRALDEYLLRVERQVRAAGAQHPCFVDVLEGHVLLVDPPRRITAPAAVESELPESVTPSGSDDLRDLVRRVVARRLGREPKIAPDGSITLSRDGARVVIRISTTRPLIEVWADVARGVDVVKARKRLARMNGSFYAFTFALRGDRVLVSTTVNASPFSPAHLDRAIDTTFHFLDREAAELAAKLARPTPGAGENAVDADLLLVLAAAGDRQQMVRLATALAAGSRPKARRWRRAARLQADRARRRAGEAQHDRVQDALIDQVIAWRAVADALAEVIRDMSRDQAA